MQIFTSMNRFKDLCNSSDSDSSVQKINNQRGRVRQSKRFKQNDQRGKEIPQKNKIAQTQNKISQIEKAERKIVLTVKKEQKLTNQQLLKVNQHQNSSSLDSKQKFIRQSIKPVQHRIQHYFQKINSVKKQRKKFINAISTANRDMQKITVRIKQLLRQQLENKHSNGAPSEEKYKQLQNMVDLQAKVQRHTVKLMKQHDKTIELIMESRKQMQKQHMKIKFQFLDITSTYILNQQTEQFQQYGIQRVYEILQSTERTIESITSFV